MACAIAQNPHQPRRASVVFLPRFGKPSPLSYLPRASCIMGRELNLLQSSRNTFCQPPIEFEFDSHQNEMSPIRMKHSEVSPTPSHRNTPCNSGHHPTSLSVVREMPLPIRNSVAVSPSRPRVKSDGLKCVTVRT